MSFFDWVGFLTYRDEAMLKSNHKPGAIIAGGHFASLAAARALGKHGISVYIVDCETCITQFSKYTKRSFRCPSEKREADLVEFMIGLATNHPEIYGSVLFVSTDEQVRIFSQNRDKLAEYYIVSVPEWNVTKYLYDKRLSCTLAKQRQVPIPETFTASSVQDLGAIDLSYPIVLKPAITPHMVSITKKKAYKAHNPQELISLYNQISEIMNPEEILIQEFIPGGTKNLYSYFGYFKEGRPLIGYSAKRLRQHPVEFGRSSTFVVSTQIPELEALATQLLTGIGYTGMAEVEFMFDSKHARFEFLEINPRIWGWLNLSMHAGVDLPYIAYADMISEPFHSGEFVDGTKWMHLATDLPTVIIEFLHGRLSIRDYLRSVHGSRDAVFCLDDPLPFLAEMTLIPNIVMRRGF
jgi:D-aspartate ligase